MPRVKRELREDHFGPRGLDVPGERLPEEELARLRAMLDTLGRQGWYRASVARDPLLELADQWAKLRLNMHRRALTPALTIAIARCAAHRPHAMPRYLREAMLAWRTHMALHFDRGLVVGLVNEAALAGEKVGMSGAFREVAKRLGFTASKVRSLYYDEKKFQKGQHQ
jgi:hypothetical protein